MAKTDDRASQYVFVEDEDIFAEDERRMGGNREAGRMALSSRGELIAAKFHQDATKLQCDAAKLRRAVKQLASIPPPPSSTNPQFSLNTILDLWHNHNNLGELKNNWNPSISEETLGHDVYLNSNKYVEELEHIRQNLQERFVSNETSSHFWSVVPLQLTELDKQLQRRNGWLKSPASRVNYLSQRKIVFSTFSNSVRTFTVDNTKKPSFLKNNLDSKISAKSQLPRRCLFQSPEKRMMGVTMPPSNYSTSSAHSSLPPSNYSVPSAASTTSSSSSSSLFTPSRSMLRKWTSSKDEVKLISSVPRSRESSGKKNCAKSLKFDDQTPSDKKDKSAKKPKKLSQLHSKKLLWAVETLLKSEGVVSYDPEYKALYSNIYKETSQIWLRHYENEPRGAVTGTSDLMVEVAKTVLPSVEQKLTFTCNAIKARKEAVKRRNFETSSTSMRGRISSSSVNESSSVNATPNGTTSLTHPHSESVTKPGEESFAFSPEVVGVSNLCDDIDAVISSLDNLPPDPDDPSCSISDSMPISSAVNQSDDHINIPINTIISPDNAMKITEKDIKINCSSDRSPDAIVANFVEVMNSNISQTVVDLKDVNSTMNDNSISDSYPVCVVKLERCDHMVEINENLKTPGNSQAKLRLSSSDKTTVTPETVLINGYNSSSFKKLVPEVDDNAEKSHNESTDLRRSKRKRYSDTKSNENTPTSSNSINKSGWKKMCFDQEVDDTVEQEVLPPNNSLDTLKIDSGEDNMNSVVGENKNITRFTQKSLSFDQEEELLVKNKVHVQELSSDQAMSSNKIVENQNVFSEAGSQVNPGNDDGSSNKQCQNEEQFVKSGTETDQRRLSIDQMDEPRKTENDIVTSGESSSTITQGESSSSVTCSDNIDKENDSSAENISDIDTQNWSPILRLKRSSKNMWSSELRKKRISKRNQKKNSTSPFLDLEGPFKYRFCKRARQGEFVLAVIKGEVYSKSYKKLVKHKSITKDCVLVRTVKQGLELRIPLILFKKERIFLGPNKFQNMVSDIIEDAVCKLEGFNFSSTFAGFTNHDINQSVISSWKMNKVLKVIETTGEVVKPLFTMYKYAIVRQSPQNAQDFYQIFVEILKTSLFLMKSSADVDTIQVRPMKSESPRKIQLEINIPVNLVVNDNLSFKESILKDLNPVHNILSF